MDRRALGLSYPPNRPPVALPPQSSLAALIAANTGKQMRWSAFAEQRERREDQRQQAERVMRVLGKRAHSAGAARSKDLVVVGLLTGHAERIPRTPRWRVFPWVAKFARQELCRDLLYYLSENPGARHLRVTQGRRVNPNILRRSMKALSKAVSRLNTRPWFEADAEIILRCCEITWDGKTVHPHAHLVVLPRRDLSEVEWITLTGRVRAHFQADVGVCEPLGDTLKAIPYLTKPTDVAQMSEQVLGVVIRQTLRLRIHEPMGGFRDFCQMLKRTNTKLARRGNDIVMVDRADGSRRQRAKQNHPVPRRQAAADPHNLVVRIGQPRPHRTSRFEPVLYVVGYDADFEGLLGRYPNLHRMRDQLLSNWTKRGCRVPASSNVPCIVHFIDQMAPAASSPAISVPHEPQHDSPSDRSVERANHSSPPNQLHHAEHSSPAERSSWANQAHKAQSPSEAEIAALLNAFSRPEYDWYHDCLPSPGPPDGLARSSARHPRPEPDY